MFKIARLLLPVLKEDCWHITRLYKGNEDTITDDMFTQELGRS